MNLDLYRRLLEVPSETGREGAMVKFLIKHVKSRGEKRCGKVWCDEHKNVYVIKGKAEYYPCLSAHIDTVQPYDRKVNIIQTEDTFLGLDEQGEPAGIGGDCKSGIMVCLEALERLDNVALALFAYEEHGGMGARNSDPEFFERIGYVLEFDCPARNLFSYSNSGVRLFQNDGEFITRAMPSLRSRSMLWQRHPYTDVTFLRKRFPLSMMNMSSGYYNWHSDNEYVRISDTVHAVDLACELVQALGEKQYPFPVHSEQRCNAKPLVEIGPLVVEDYVLEASKLRKKSQQVRT